MDHTRSAAINPGAAETCGDTDQNCDGDNWAGAVDQLTYYLDGDGDGHFSTAPVQACPRQMTNVATQAVPGDDCDDADPTQHPGHVELCNNRDDDCNGLVDDGASGDTPGYLDRDGDGHGGTYYTTTCATLVRPVADDCNDADATVFPGAVERCDGQDSNCDAVVDSPVPNDAPVWWLDADGDGYGDATQSRQACASLAQHVDRAGDCNDARVDVHPGATEVWDDGVDSDCDGIDPESESDTEGDTEPDTEGDRGGCRTVPGAPSGLLWALAGLTLRRRRWQHRP